MDGDVARALPDAGDATASAGAPALQRRPLVDIDGVDHEVVAAPVQRRVRLGVRDGRREHLLDLDRSGALGERQDRPRLRDAAPADVVRHEPRLARRHPDELGRRLHGPELGSVALDCWNGRHQRFFTCVFWSPAWPRKWRVGANSPSLCPTICSEMNTGTCFFPSWTAIVW